MVNELTLFFSIDTFHRISYFLGTDQGEFFKRSIELLLYTLLSYMIISEFRKSKRKELIYLMVGFVSLMIHRLLLVFFNANILFAQVDLSSLDFFLPILLSSLQLVSIILIVNAFL